MNSRPPKLDDLLPLYRRGIFNDDVESHTREAIQAGQPLGLVMIDLDHFKRINDQYGHPVGDEVLKSVAEILKRITSTKGTCYRYGGEEMCILLPNYSANEAVALAERVRREIEATSITGQGLKVTASFGVAVLPSHASTAADLLCRADEAVYEEGAGSKPRPNQRRATTDCNDTARYRTAATRTRRNHRERERENPHILLSKAHSSMSKR